MIREKGIQWWSCATRAGWHDIIGRDLDTRKLLWWTVNGGWRCGTTEDVRSLWNVVQINEGGLRDTIVRCLVWGTLEVRKYFEYGNEISVQESKRQEVQAMVVIVDGRDWLQSQNRDHMWARLFLMIQFFTERINRQILLRLVSDKSVRPGGVRRTGASSWNGLDS